MLKAVEREGGREGGGGVWVRDEGLHTHPERVTQEIRWKKCRERERERERERGVGDGVLFCLVTE